MKYIIVKVTSLINIWFHYELCLEYILPVVIWYAYGHIIEKYLGQFYYEISIVLWCSFNIQVWSFLKDLYTLNLFLFCFSDISCLIKNKRKNRPSWRRLFVFYLVVIQVFIHVCRQTYGVLVRSARFNIQKECGLSDSFSSKMQAYWTFRAAPQVGRRGELNCHWGRIFLEYLNFWIAGDCPMKGKKLAHRWTLYWESWYSILNKLEKLIGIKTWNA